MKRVLLLGDSIRLNYAPYVYRKLSDKAHITTPEDNGRFAKYTLHELPGWLKTLGTPDIVHWNNGLWDLHHFDGCHPLTPLADYIQDLERVAMLLKTTGAHIIFATCTTPLPENPEWDNREVDTYNQAAKRLMERLNIPVNDLYRLTAGKEAQFINQDDLIHLNREGIRLIGEQVVQTIEPLL